jgi:hypothetical protein
MELNKEYAQLTGFRIFIYMFYATRIITPIGIFLNICSFLIFTRERFHKTTMGFYNMALAIFDILALTITFILFFPITIGNDLSVISDVSCKLISFLVRTFTQVPSWLQVMVSFDRMLSVKYPQRFSLLNKKSFLAGIIGIIVCMVMIINIPNFFMNIEIESSFDSTTNSTRIKKSCTGTFEMLLVRDLIGLTNRTIVPFILMISFNIVIIRKLLKTKRGIFKNKSQQNIRNRSNKKEYQFAFSIIAINISFLLILSPLTIGQILKYIFMIGLTEEQQEIAVIVVTLNYMNFISIYIALLNNALSFFTNLVFNKLFRQELQAIITNSAKVIGVATIFTVHDSSNTPGNSQK